MAKRDERTMTFAVTPGKLLAVLTHPDYQLAREKALGALEARVEEKSRSTDALVYEVHATTHARGITGVDKTKTETSVTTYQWDLKTMRATWIHAGPHGGMAKVNGSLQIQPDGSGAKLTTDFNIEVKIPLVGGKVEKMVLESVGKTWLKFEEVIREYCQKLA